MSEPTFFGKIMDLIDREATDARPRPAPDVVRDLVAALARLIEAAPADHRDGLRAIISRLGLEHDRTTAALAFAALYRLLDLRWIRILAPSD
jgi:hypothetical protein